MQEFWHTLKDTILNPEWYIEYGGLYMILAVIFAETGLFIGFFFPGDSLLFVAGIFLDKLATEFFDVHYLVICTLISIAGILGNFVGYWFGRKSGPLLYKKEDSFFFRKKHLQTATKFYEENGAFTIILGRFMPIIRTFAPIVAGIVEMDYKKFTLYNIVGSFAWVFSMTLAGRFLHKFILDKYGMDITDRLEIIVIVIIAVTTAPVIYKFIKESRKAKKAN